MQSQRMLFGPPLAHTSTYTRHPHVSPLRCAVSTLVVTSSPWMPGDLIPLVMLIGAACLLTVDLSTVLIDYLTAPALPASACLPKHKMLRKTRIARQPKKEGHTVAGHATVDTSSATADTPAATTNTSSGTADTPAATTYNSSAIADTPSDTTDTPAATCSDCGDGMVTLTPRVIAFPISHPHTSTTTIVPPLSPPVNACDF